MLLLTINFLIVHYCTFFKKLSLSCRRSDKKKKRAQHEIDKRSSVELQLTRTGMVSIEHGTILHGSDSARPIEHGPIVHENNRAPYRLDTVRFSTGSIVHKSVLQKRLGTGSIVHESFMQKRFGTGSIVHETVIQERFSTGSIVHESVVHESVMQKRFSTSSIMHSSYSYSYIKKDANPLRLSIVLSHHMHRN